MLAPPQGPATGGFPRLSSRGPIEAGLPCRLRMFGEACFRDYQVAAPLKRSCTHAAPATPFGFRDYQVAAPLKLDAEAWTYGNW